MLKPKPQSEVREWCNSFKCCSFEIHFSLAGSHQIRLLSGVFVDSRPAAMCPSTRFPKTFKKHEPRTSRVLKDLLSVFVSVRFSYNTNSCSPVSQVLTSTGLFTFSFPRFFCPGFALQPLFYSSACRSWEEVKQLSLLHTYRSADCFISFFTFVEKCEYITVVLRLKPLVD